MKRRSPAPRLLAPIGLLALVALALLGSGCSNNNNALCPAGTQQAGVFSTTLNFNSADTNQCRITTDGGSLAASPTPFTSAICSALDGGQPLVYLALPAFDRVSVLGDGGSFVFGSASVVSGTSCGCDVFVTETITGTLTPATAGTTVALDADGGLPALSGFTGTVVDEIDGGLTDSGTPCICNIPCDLQYALGATPL